MTYDTSDREGLKGKINLPQQVWFFNFNLIAYTIMSQKDTTWLKQH